MKTSRIDEVVLRMSAPSRPEPMTLRVRHVLTDYEIEHACRNFDDWVNWTKAYMARQIASHIVEKCGVVKIPNFGDLRRGQHEIEMEFTINDASAYARELPMAERKGHDIGRKEGIAYQKARAPYGTEPDQFYE